MFDFNEVIPLVNAAYEDIFGDPDGVSDEAKEVLDEALWEGDYENRELIADFVMEAEEEGKISLGERDAILSVVG